MSIPNVAIKTISWFYKLSFYGGTKKRCRSVSKRTGSISVEIPYRGPDPRSDLFPKVWCMALAILLRRGCNDNAISRKFAISGPV